MLRYHSGEQNAFATNDHFPPISRTLRYKKVTKPLLERKRRARMNKCLDELKDLVCAMEADGENINKLEKADILELTVRHLKRISRLQDPVQEAHRFQAGFSQCAHEVCSFLVSLPGLNSAVGHQLIDHLKQCISRHRSPYSFPTVDRRQSVSSSKSLQVNVVSSQRFSPPLSPSVVSNFRKNDDKKSTNISSSLNESDDSSRSVLSKTTNDTNERGVSPSSSDGMNPMWRPW